MFRYPQPNVALRLRKAGVVLVLLLVVPSFAVDAAESEERALPMHLDEAIALALEHNLNLAIQREALVAGRVGVMQAEGAFDPSFNAGYSISEDQRPLDAESSLAADGLTRARTESDSASIGVSGSTPLSTGYSLSASNRSSADTFNEFRDEHATSGSVSLTQPLLRGRGRQYATYGVRVAKRSLAMGAIDLSKQTQQTVLEVEQAYWSLFEAQRSLDVRQKSVAAAASLLEQVEIQVEVGTAGEAELVQAQSGLAQRKLSVVTAERAYSQQHRGLMSLLSTGLDATDLQIELLDTPNTNRPVVAVEVALEEALARRPEVQSLALERANADEALQRAIQDRLPQLDLEGSYGLCGLGGSFGDSFSEARSQEDNNWTLGLVYRRSWPDRQRKGELLQQRSAVRTLELRSQLLQQQISQEIRDLVDRLTGALDQIRAGELALRYARLNLENEQAKFDVQKSTVHNLLQLETDLLEAQMNQLGAIAEYQKTEAELVRARGALLERWGIVLDSLDE